MKKTVIKLYPECIIGQARPRIFSSFVEHMGSCVYNGLYEPGHREADGRGFRKDVLELAKALRLPAIRYPGGNFTSGYNWEDTVGQNRPVRLDLAWRQTEPNTFGLHEFFEWAVQLGADSIMTVNLGTRGANEARCLLEYMNHPRDTLYSDMRRNNGREKPFGVRTWCLGNELDGPWQLGHKTALEYGHIAAQTARVMRQFDPSLELVAVGSSATELPTYPEWDRQILMECYDDVDYIALHKYISHENIDTPAYLASPMGMERQIKDIIATCDYVHSVKRSKKKLKLAFDEWNVVSYAHNGGVTETPWQVGPDQDKKTYTLEDALAFGSMMLTLIRNADRIEIACQAILVNVLPMIVANKQGKSCASTIYYPFLHGSLYGRGTALQCFTDTPLYDCQGFEAVPIVDTAAVWNQEDGTLTVFIVIRGPEAQRVEIAPRGFGQGYRTLSHLVLAGDLHSANTPENPEACLPTERRESLQEGKPVEVLLQGYSWNVIRLQGGQGCCLPLSSVPWKRRGG